MNDNIERSAGSELLTEYGEALEKAAEKAKRSFFEADEGDARHPQRRRRSGARRISFVRPDVFARAYHIGGGEFALLVVAPKELLTDDLAQQITASIAAIEPIAKLTARDDVIPTMIRVGACAGEGEGESMMQVASEAERDVRRTIYMKGFGSLDARGAVIARDDPKLKGIPNWRVIQFDNSRFIGGLSDEAVKSARDEEAKKDRPLGTSF